jgi:hypothetical protein
MTCQRRRCLMCGIASFMCTSLVIFLSIPTPKTNYVIHDNRAQMQRAGYEEVCHPSNQSHSLIIHEVRYYVERSYFLPTHSFNLSKCFDMLVILIWHAISCMDINLAHHNIYTHLPSITTILLSIYTGLSLTSDYYPFIQFIIYFHTIILLHNIIISITFIHIV